MIRRTFQTAVSPVNDRQLRAILATEQLGRDNLIIRLGGIETPANLVGLFNHDPAVPVCRWTELEGVRYGSPALATFPPAGTSQQADECLRLAKAGVIDSVSIGFEPIEIEPDRQNRGAKIVTRSELLEASWVAVPADRGARVVERDYRRSLTGHVEELDEHIAEAQRHHADVARVMRRNRMDDAARSHRSLKRCLDDAQRCVRAIANDGMLQDIANSQSLQTSSGVGKGTSSAYATPLSRAERQLEALRLQRPAGGAVDAAATRDREFLRRLVHCEQVGRAMATDGDFAERQRELRQLARLG